MYYLKCIEKLVSISLLKCVFKIRVSDYKTESRLRNSVKSVSRHSGWKVIFYHQNTQYLVVPHHAAVPHVTLYHRP